MEKVRFPQYLGAPPQLIWWESDELAVILLFVGLAIEFGGLFWVLPAAAVLGLPRLKRGYPKGFLRHVFYFLGLTRLQGYPEYWDKEFLE